MTSRSLSMVEARVVLSLEGDGESVVTLDDLRRRAGVSPGHARAIAHRLVRKGWLERGRRGVYLLNPSQHGPDALPDRDPFRVGRLLADPYYFGYGTAAELHGLLPQAGQAYYVVTPGRSGRRPFGPSEFRFVHCAPARFFGAESLRRRSIDLRVSDRERTVLDCVDRPELAGGMAGAAHILAIAKPNLRWATLADYAIRFRNRAVAQRLGYLAATVRPSHRPPRAFLDRLRPPNGAAYVPLGPAVVHGRRGVHDPTWRVVRNVPESQLYAEGRLR